MRKVKLAWRLIARGTVALGLMVLVGSVTAGFSVASAQVEMGVGAYADVNLGEFNEALSPYGDWVYVSHFGRVWRPYRAVVGVDFRPYLTGGSWVSTNYGWSFESGYEWGWAPFHYGRWWMDPYYGWVWVPDTVWAPAWVDWRFGGGYVGWAPLAPVGFSVGFGFYRPTWCFVPTPQFVVRDVYRYALPVERFHAAFAVTTPVRNEVVYSGARWNAGPPPGQVSHAAGLAILPAGITPPRPGVVQSVHPSGVPAGIGYVQKGAAPAASPPPAALPAGQARSGRSVQAPPPGAAPGPTYGRSDPHGGRASGPPKMESGSAPGRSTSTPQVAPAPSGSGKAPPPGVTPGAANERSNAHWGRSVQAPPSGVTPGAANGRSDAHWGRSVQAPPPGATPGAANDRSDAHWGRATPPRMDSRSAQERSISSPQGAPPPSANGMGPAPGAHYGGAAHGMAPPPAGAYSQSHQGMHMAPTPAAPPQAQTAPRSQGHAPAPPSGGGGPPPGHPHFR